MKISKNILMVLGVVILVAAGVILYMAYSQYANQRDALFVTIDTANKKFALVSGEKRTLEPQVTQLQQKIDELNATFTKAKGEFPNVTIQSLEYDEALTRLAEDAGVTVQILTASDSARQVDGNLTYIVTDFTAEVTGERANALDFLHRVAVSNYFTSATINSLDMNEEIEPTPTTGATDEPPPINFSTMRISLTIYRYEGN
jgi:hypothetical protein